MEELLGKIESLQMKWVEDWHVEDTGSKCDGFLGVVEKQHLQNFRLWHQEDIARVPDVDDAVIADVKRKIDTLNQNRNDLMEKIDEFILTWLSLNDYVINQEAELNSETPGSMIDRCSIMSLKIYHMREESTRESATEEHREKAKDKVNTLLEQRADLDMCLSTLFNQVKNGTRRFKLYRQFKMYNDPSLNPQVYNQAK